MTIRMDNLANMIRHELLVPPRDRLLELYVLGVGSRNAPPYTPYQVFEEDSPYQWQHGRTLSDYALVYLTHGSGVFRSRKTSKCKVQAGDMLLLRPGVWHDYFPDAKTGWREHWVVFSGHHAARLLAPLGPPQRTAVLHPGIDRTLNHFFNEMMDTSEARKPHANTAQSGLLLQILARVLSRVELQKEGGRQEQSIIQKARHYMETHFAEPIDMPALAVTLHISYRHFRRIFKASLGMPPHQYLLDLRIMRARRILEEEELKISELAKRVGFEDVYYFSRIFKQKTGLSPVLWRRG